MSYARQDYPRWAGPSEVFWQNLVHWRRKWPTHCSILSWRTPWTVWKDKRYDTPEDKPPRLEGFQNATVEGERAITNSSRKNKVGGPKQKQHLVVDVSGGECKIWCCKEQYCIGTWNVRSINQGKLGVIKQEMTRVSINILGIRKLKWTGMDEFNSDDHYIYFVGRDPLEEME